VPWFRVQLHGTGISLQVEGGSDPAIGFYCHRDARAVDATRAQAAAIAQVLADWSGDGAYAAANKGNVPTLVVEDCWAIGWVKGWFGRKPAGHSFYARDD
jgi:hypothetical protein